MENLKIITIPPVQAYCLYLIHSGCFGHTLQELREKEKACLNKGTIKLYIDALEAVEKAKPAIDRIIEASIAELKQHRQAENN